MEMGEVVDIRDLARQDQEEAREREFERRAKWWAGAFLVATALLGIWAVLIATGVAPAMPWSPMGQGQ